MGLIKAIGGAINGVLADSWRDYYYCESMSADILAKKGVKRAGPRSSNTKGTENIISNGSVIAVNEGQCMIIVDQGKVVDFCAEPGEFLYDTSTEPSMFYGGFGKGLLDSFKNVGKRFTFGGEPGKDQRLYFFNTKEIVGNKYGTANPVPFRVVDKNIGLDIDLAIRCFGEYSYKIVDPLVFYTNVCGNVTDDYDRGNIDSQLKTELMTALQPAFARISEMGIRYSALPGHTQEIADALNTELSEKWQKMRGLAVASFGVSSVSAPEEDEEMIKELQKAAVFRNTGMAAAGMVSAQADAMRSAASNPNAGPMMAFAGMNMAANAGGANAQNLFAMEQQQAAAQQQAQAAAQTTMRAQQTPAAGTWKCECGAENTGKFCMECGKPKPAETGTWKCECGAENTGKFCMECGKPKPAGAMQYKCDKCGWVPEDPAHPPKFCPECGDPFGDEDATK